MANNHQKFEDDAFGPLNRLTQILRDHDERGLILTLAAFAEEALGRLIQAFMRPVKASEELLNGFNAPLGTFSSRIKAGYALGLINEEQFKDLECLRKIRNEFAHAWEHVSLKHDRLAAYVQSMSFSYLDDKFPETSMDKVKSSISALLADVSSMTHQIQIKGGQVKVSISGTRLFPLTFHGEFADQVRQARETWEFVSAQYKEATGERRRFWHRRLEHLKLQVDFLLDRIPIEMHPAVLEIRANAEHLLKA